MSSGGAASLASRKLSGHVGRARGLGEKGPPPKAEIELYLRTTIPCRRADLVMVSSSDSDEHSEPSE